MSIFTNNPANFYPELRRYLENIEEEAKDQIIRFLMEDPAESTESMKIIWGQIESFNRMYPEFDRRKIP